MADEIDYKIHGEDLQLVEIFLDPNEAVYAEAGAMVIMEQGIEMKTGTGGGLFSGLKRMISGEGFFITHFVNTAQKRAAVAFSAPYPGRIIPINLSETGTFLCQKDAFLCSAAGIDISVSFTRKLGAGIFGGEGFILQKLQGDGLAFLHAGGTILRRSLEKGQTLRVDAGCLVGFTEQVDYDIVFVGGFTNALFGGEGLFLAQVTGPGTVFLQSQPFSRLADRIIAASALIKTKRE